MAIKRITVNGRKVWQVRVAYKGLRKSTLRDSKAAAREAESALLQELKAKAGQAIQQGQAPATLRSLFEFYAADLEQRGRSGETIGRAVETAHAVERLMPDLLDRRVDRIEPADLFAFRKRRAESSCRAIGLRARAEVLRRDGEREDADALERQALAAEREGTSRPPSIAISAHCARCSKRCCPTTDSPPISSSPKMRRGFDGSGRRKSCSCSTPCGRRFARSPSWPR